MKKTYVLGVFMVCIAMLPISNTYARQWSLESSINARSEYNDNIFLTSGPHDAVTGMTITPALSGVINEKNWEAKLRARLRINKYSDHTIDGNDQFFDLTGRYNAQRNIFSLNINHDLDSNLSSASTDFAIVGRRVERKSQSISPQYTRLLTERLNLTLSYTYSDVDFLDVENRRFIPYSTETAFISFQYDLTEKNKLSFMLQAVDYRSKNDLTTYQLFVSRIGVDHQFSKILSVDFQAGVSRRNSTSLNTLSQKIDFHNRGFVMDAGVTQRLENGRVEGRISRDDTTNSFGGLDQVDKFIVTYTQRLSSLWRYDISARFEDISSVSTNNGSTDRDLFLFETKVYYSITPKWVVNASYRYSARKFKSDASESRAPHSNRVYVGMTYNFPSLSTF